MWEEGARDKVFRKCRRPLFVKIHSFQQARDALKMACLRRESSCSEFQLTLMRNAMSVPKTRRSGRMFVRPQRRWRKHSPIGMSLFSLDAAIATVPALSIGLVAGTFHGWEAEREVQRLESHLEF